jgi:hypothetical protein
LIAWIVSFFAVLFTGRYPRALFDFNAGAFRWSQRVMDYVLLSTDEYPPFSLEDHPNYPVRVQFEYPERIANWRPLVQWLLAIPYVIVATMLLYIWYVVIFIAWFAILFTGRYPQSLFDFGIVAQRWYLRGNAYAYWMTDRYPPWAWG